MAILVLTIGFILLAIYGLFCSIKMDELKTKIHIMEEARAEGIKRINAVRAVIDAPAMGHTDECLCRKCIVKQAVRRALNGESDEQV